MLPLSPAQPKEQPRLLQQLSRFYLLPFPEEKIRIPYNLNAPRNYSHAALKALSGLIVTSRLVAECLVALLALADLNEVTLIWVPGQQSVFGNEEADGRQASAIP